MANIGNLAVTLALDATAFTAGLSKTAKDADSFAAGLTKTLSGVSAGLAVGGAGLGLAEGAFSWMKKGLDDVANLGTEARKLGVSTEFMSTVQYEAGRAADGLGHAMQHLNVELFEAGRGSVEAAAKFQKLGLNGKELAGLGLEGAWKKIADRMAGMTDAAEKAALAHELFGREAGAALIPVLSKGAAGLAEAEKAAKKFGWSVSAIDAAKAIVAQRAMDDLGKTFEGIQRTAAIEFAPIITDIANGVSDMIGKAGGGKAIFKALAEEARDLTVTMLKGVEDIGVGLADFAQKIDKITHATENLGQKMKLIAGGIFATKTGQGWLDVAKETIKPGWGSGGAMPETAWGKGIKDTLDPLIKGISDKGGKSAIDKMIADLEKLGTGGAAGDATVGAKKLTDGIDALQFKLQGEIATFGMAGDAMERWKLVNEGATAAQLAGVDAFEKQLEGLKKVAIETKRLTDLTAKIATDTADPFDGFKKGLADLDTLMAAGKINADTYALEFAKDFDSMAKGLGGMHKDTHVGAMQEGSLGDYQARLKFEDMGRQGDVQERMEATLKQIRDQGAQHLREAKALRDIWEKINVKDK